MSALNIIVPTYLTNATPVLLGGGKPIDFGKSFRDGERIFGDNKTWRGLFFGMLIGTVTGVGGYFLFWKGFLLLAILASTGALMGDLAGAFAKRRLKIRPGGVLIGVDQLDFVLGALLFVSPFYEISLGAGLTFVLVTPPIHFLTNVGAYLLGLKSSYW